MRRALILFLTLLLPLGLVAQPTQTARITTVDALTLLPVPYTAVQIWGNGGTYTTQADSLGVAELQKVPIGSYNIGVQVLGYETQELHNVEVLSGKQLQLTLRLTPSSVSIDEVVVQGDKRDTQPRSKLAMVSTRSFAPDDTRRFAGSWGDPSRMVANYAGVMGADDSRNDIIIRGNSPNGLLWRMEGIDIPNPNHFASEGSTGGPVSMVNHNLLSRSDFMTGAFPAEFGNALSGVFDLHLRPGNITKYEFVGEVGWTGFELGAEGPIGNKTSFVADYRYSTLALFSRLHLPIDVGLGSAIPYYQDLTFKVQAQVLGGTLSLFGLGGLSDISLLSASADKKNTAATSNFDIYFGAKTGASGLNYTHPLGGDRGTLSVRFGLTGTHSSSHLDSVAPPLPKKNYYSASFTRIEPSANVELRYKLGSRDFIQANLQEKLSLSSYNDSVVRRGVFQLRAAVDNGKLWQTSGSFAWRHQFGRRFTTVAGLYGLYFAYTKSWAVEPRLSAQVKVLDNLNFTLSAGMHSQQQTPYVYFVRDYATGEATMRNLDLTRALHGVLGISYSPIERYSIKVEGYFQHLYDVPVSASEIPQYTLLNAGDGYILEFYAKDLKNTGKGRNYGVEITLERTRQAGWYALLTASLFRSQYMGSNGVWYSTRYDGGYVANALAGYEYRFTPKFSLALDASLVMSGGKRETPVDLKASQANKTEELDWSKAYTLKQPMYLKANAKISGRLQGRRITQEWFFELQNFTNHKNLFSRSYDAATGEVVSKYQMGLTPMGGYRILF